MPSLPTVKINLTSVWCQQDAHTRCAIVWVEQRPERGKQVRITCSCHCHR